MPKTKYCTNCGNQVDKKTEICPKCGLRQPEIEKKKYCTNCGNQIDTKAEICPKCVVRQLNAINQYYPGPEKKNPILAAILSVFMIGLGQLYNGDVYPNLFLK